MPTPMKGSIRLEQLFQVGHGSVSIFALYGGPGAGPEILAAICTILIKDSLRIALTAFVVRSGIVMFAIETDVQIGPTAITGISKADGLACGQRNCGVTGVTLHPASVLQNRRVRHVFAGSWSPRARTDWDSRASVGSESIAGPSLVWTGTDR